MFKGTNHFTCNPGGWKIMMVQSPTEANNFNMSLKYRRSVLFDKPNTTTLQLALQTILHDCKERLQLNSRSKSRVLPPTDSVERLNVRQARTI